VNAEQQRVAENNKDERWYLWGPYLAERAWGTVREDYSANGDAWNYFSHDQARSRVFRWGEDGIGGISDFKQRLCLAFAFWNGQDPFIKERLFGVTGPQGSHGEDVKEIYFYTDATPTHSYLRMLYRYPQKRFPYEELVAANHGRARAAAEPEIWDTGILSDDRYFDIVLEYAKVDPDDFFISVTATNRGPDAADLHVLPTLWFRNTWAWGRDKRRPILRASSDLAGHCPTIQASHGALGDYKLHCEGARDLLFTENETNTERLFASPNRFRFVKDGINDFIVDGRSGAVNPDRCGTKAAAHYAFTIEPGASKEIRLWFGRVAQGAEEAESGEPGTRPRIIVTPVLPSEAFEHFDTVIRARRREADEFYAASAPACLSDEHRLIHRQALAGMIWSKQFYHYVVEDWLEGDPGQPVPPEERKNGRNAEWRHLYNERVMSMPDTWEYPWYAAWDLAFHCIPLALVDPHFAKGQLDIILREWYQHPNGQVPAYEWNFGDVNPPVIGWAAWRVYKIDEKQNGKGDRLFLETVFHKLLISFTWWVNRKDSEGKNIFQGGFLGLDNIGVFDRSAPLPGGGHLEQSDGTSWMGMFCLNLMRMALELARENPAYENIATKFFEHFLGIAGAMNNLGEGIGLWDEADEFFYDVLHMPDGRYLPLRVRSLVGLMPLLAVETIEAELLDAMPGFKERLEWYLENKRELAALISRWHDPGAGDRRLIALTRGHRMKCLLRRMLDPAEFLSDFGIRSLSKHHSEQPYVLHCEDGAQRVVRYDPGESQSSMFGGNSNWRGPVWLPINYLLIESLQKFHHYYGDDFKVECPTGSGQHLTLNEIANDLSNRLIRLWLRDGEGVRPFERASGDALKAKHDRDLYWFHEYFHGDTGAGLGASHQTGWTGLIAKLIQQQGEGGTIAERDPFTDL
jgi:hypothetical protein